MMARVTGTVRWILVMCAIVLLPALAMAQGGQAAGSVPLEQPLVREGDFAVKLVEALNLGRAESEAEAESMLASLDIMPENGWIADYPVTPDIADELQAAVGEAANAGKITLSEEAAMNIVQNVLRSFDLSVAADTSGRGSGETVPSYPDSAAENDYYYEEGPPVVTYYAPPPDYAYLYSWVPYPFWWSDIWFPGFFILVDFDVDVDRHRHRHKHDHDHHRGKTVSNHFVDPKSGKTFRIDPAKRTRGGFQPAGAGWSRPSAQTGAAAILKSRSGRTATGTYKEFKGYGSTGSPTGTRSSAFDISPNSQFERKASDRGFQSRSGAGRVGGGSPSVGTPSGGAGGARPSGVAPSGGAGGARPSGGTPSGGRSGGGGGGQGGGFGGFHGGGGFRR